MSEEFEWVVTLNFLYGNEKTPLVELLKYRSPNNTIFTFLHMA